MMWENFLSILSRNNVDHNLSTVIPKRALWGVAPTGSSHIGYLPYIGILKQLKSLGSNIIILIADYHAYLDSEKTKWPHLKSKTRDQYNLFKAFGFEKETVILSKIYCRRYHIDNFYRFSRTLPTNALIEYANTTLQAYFTEDYKFSDFLYVATQIYDIDYFDVDLVLSGKDECGIYKLGLPIIDNKQNKKRFFAYIPLIPGIEKEEMHASDDESNKIVLYEEIDNVKEKIKKYLNHSFDKNSKPTLIYMIVEFILPLFDVKVDNQIINSLCRHQKKDIPDIAERISESLDVILKPIRDNMGGGYND